MSLRAIISDERLGPYLQEAGFNEDRALLIYAWNMRLCSAFYPVMGAAEIALRNRVADRLVAVYGAQWWSHQTFLGHLGKKGIGIVKRAQGALARRGRVADTGRMTAELSFGFWVNMLLPKYEPDLWSPIMRSFPDLPAGVNLTALLARGEHLRDFRNRMFHHEPIFRRDILLEHSRCIEFIGWMSPVKADWIRKQSEVVATMQAKP